MKKIVTLFLILVLSAICLYSSAENSTTLSFDAESYTLFVNKSLNLKPIFTPKSNMKLDWSSSDEAIASVTKSGAVKAKSVGSVTITAKAKDNENITASCIINVMQPVKKIAFVDKSISLAVNTSQKLNYNILPEDTSDKTMQFSSSNEKIASVDQSGVITGLSKGNAKITLIAQDGSKVKASINVKVDEYDMVFTSMAPQLGTYYYGTGRYTITGKVKNGNVQIPEINTYMMASVIGGLASEQFPVTPVKAGTDVITIKAGRNKTTIKVYVSPDCFKLEDLGDGNGLVQPGSYGIYKGHTYKIIRKDCSWFAAVAECEQQGGHLVTITSAEEEAFIETLLGDVGNLWIGLHRKANTLNEWEWVTGEAFSYSKWAEGQPDNRASGAFDGENAVVIWPDWNDQPEDDFLNPIPGYIIEWDYETHEF